MQGLKTLSAVYPKTALLNEPVFEREAILGVFVAQLLDGAVLVHFLQGLADLLGGLRITLLEADCIMFGGKRLVKHDICIGLRAHLILSDGEVAGNCINGAGLKLHERRIVLSDGFEVGEGGGQIGAIAFENVKSGRVGLGDDVFAGKIGKACNTLVCLHARQ